MGRRAGGRLLQLPVHGYWVLVQAAGCIAWVLVQAAGCSAWVGLKGCLEPGDGQAGLFGTAQAPCQWTGLVFLEQLTCRMRWVGLQRVP